MNQIHESHSAIQSKAVPDMYFAYFYCCVYCKKMPVDEDQLTEALSKVLLKDAIDGLDEDLVSYMAGLLASKVAEDEGDFDATPENAIDEVLVPFLESVACPENVMVEARQVVMELLAPHVGAGVSKDDMMGNTTRKLKQGIVNMASDLFSKNHENSHEADANAYLWGTSKGVKPSANILKDAHTEKTSQKDKRKQRQELETQRRALEVANQSEDDKGPKSLVSMSSSAFKNRDATKNKAKDVQVRNVSVSLDNGTVLLDGGDIKFVYQRRYGLIGENGVGTFYSAAHLITYLLDNVVLLYWKLPRSLICIRLGLPPYAHDTFPSLGKTTLLKAIAKEDGIPGFPAHLRVLHVRQEMPELKDDLSVIQAVIDSDVERTMLMQQEKDLLAKLEGDSSSSSDAVVGDEKLSLQAKREKLQQGKENNIAFNADLKKLDEVYERLQGLGSDSAEARAAMILSGLQFTHQMQTAPISSLSGGWQMRVALAAALFVEPDICLLVNTSDARY
jgi:ABC transporter